MDYFQQRVFIPDYGSLNDPFERSAHIEPCSPEFILAKNSLFNEMLEGLKKKNPELTKENLIKSLQAPDYKYTEEISDHLSEQVRSECSKNGVLCLSSSNNLMWSHYADNHKGCCLEFEIDFSHEIIKKEFKKNDDEFQGYLDNILKRREIFVFFDERDPKNIAKFVFSKVNYLSEFPSIYLETWHEIKEEGEYS